MKITPENLVKMEQTATANARLIAAAPELLGALKAIYREISDLEAESDETCPYSQATIDAMEKAIAKAEGRE
jgi:hypothetical protein